MRSLRRLLRAPGFTLSSIGLVAVGVAAATCSFSVVDAVWLEPLSPEEDRVVVAYRTSDDPARGPEPVSLLDFYDWREQASGLDAAGAFGIAFGSRAVFNGDRSVDARGVAVTPGFFDALGVRPVLGRGFAPEEELAESELTVVVSYRLWQSMFGGEETILGRRLELDAGVPYTVVGVAPEGFSFPHQNDLWLVARREPPIDRRAWSFMLVVAKLVPGARIEELEAELDAIDRRLWESTRPADVAYGAGVAVVAWSDYAIGRDTRATIAGLGSSIALLIGVTVLNLASLFLVRASARGRETAIHRALGASRWRLASSALPEVGIVSLLGGVIGLWLAPMGLATFLALGPDDIPRLQQAAVDARAVLAATAQTLGLALAVAVAHAWEARRRTSLEVLSSAGAGSGSASRIARAFATVQVAVAAFLVVAASLLAASLLRLEDADMGYRAEGLLAFDVSGPFDGFENPEQQRRVLGALLPELDAVGSVVSAAAVSMPPFVLGRVGTDMWFVTEDQGIELVAFERPDFETGETRTHYAPANDAIESNPTANWESITERYFETMEIPLIAGRTFDERDTLDARRVVIVGQSFADRYWPNESAVGKRMLTWGHRYDEDRRAEWQVVVGVVGNARYREPDGSRLDVYVPYTQAGFVPASFVARTRGDPLGVVPEVRELVARVDPSLRVERVRSMTAVVDAQLRPWRFNAYFGLAFGVTVLALAAAGVFSVQAQNVSHRFREVGIRLCLGASERDVLRWILRHGMFSVALGLAIGVTAAWMASELLSSRLYGVAPTDPWTYLAAASVILTTGWLACYLPARRASHVQPNAVLRSE